MQDRHIKVDDNLDLRNVNTPSQHICSDDNVDLALAELGHYDLTLLVAHVSEHDSGLVVILTKGVLDKFTELLCIYKNDCLGQCASVEDFHNEFDLLFGFAAELVLLDVVQVELLFLLGDRGCVLAELVDGVDCLWWVGGTKQDPLEFG